MVLELKLVASALGIIYLGSHAAIRRPPSARPPKGKHPGGKADDDDRFSQGLEPSDAILFPVMAGIVLMGLYYLIQWLKDPAVLNKILRYYMTTASIASILTLYAHGMDLVTSFVFPTYWRGWNGSLRRVDQQAKTVQVCDDSGNVGAVTGKNPLPGILSVFAATERGQKVVWELRSLLTRHWTIKLFVHGVGEETAKIRLSHMMGLFLSLATALLYFSTHSAFLSNMLGYGMCYGSFLILSPTDFLTASLVLWGLFLYDVVMVFYTPYMVTVATTLEVPIKLTFEVASRKSILGLGDIVIPGMVIAWALRLDLWLHYVRKIKYEPTDLTMITKDESSGELVRRSEVKHKEVKARYVDAKNKWGEGLWTRENFFLSFPSQLPVELAAARFPKTYFYAAMTGYTLGMAVTLAMLLLFKRGQPALLYLVPCVLGSMVLTALVRGEWKDMWKYTEDGSLDTVDVVVELDGQGKAITTIGLLENGIVDTTKEKQDRTDGKQAGDEKKVVEANLKEATARRGHKVFLLSIEAAPETEGE
ncbi:intramembrane protease [Metarhizium album ARSEF 1941]|uniref:Intramembrane protease n=1 Tax=Metarhizium album (strain ARSEF 1941) TaxID=1081103 RepID=A0A0B2WR66_METAS|nr:intramembrane protease [Metarhizium album ARSEF 1941]KHN96508.1 intramembrane protease [Metarhizium album ARSEF 1941]